MLGWSVYCVIEVLETLIRRSLRISLDVIPFAIFPVVFTGLALEDQSVNI
jgi:hypothetical protein